MSTTDTRSAWPAPGEPQTAQADHGGSGGGRAKRRRTARIEPRALRRPVVAIVVVMVTWAVAFPGSPLRSAGAALCIGVTASAGVVVTHRTTRAARLCLAALAFLPWLAVRHSPWLISVDVILFGVLLMNACAAPPAESAPRSARAFLRRIGVSWRSSFAGPFVAGQAAAARVDTTRIPVQRILAAARSAVVPLAVTLICLVLLASGDALFASYLDPWWLVQSAAGRVASALLGAAVFVWIFGAAHAPAVFDDRSRPASSPAPVLFTLAGLAVTIGAYGATQVSAAMLGADYVRERTGLTYADYARSGFFQLVAVAAIAATAVAMARPMVRADIKRRAATWLAAVVTLAVLAMVAASIAKLAVYTDTFGLTMLRLYTTLFAVWIGAAVTLTFAALARPAQDWLVRAVLTTAAVGAFAMNIADPERIVADHNLDRAIAGSSLDVAYLSRLSADATPAILAARADLDPALWSSIEGRWCPSTAGASAGGFSWNLAVRDERRAQTLHCL